jgi:hypothetical protein
MKLIRLLQESIDKKEMMKHFQTMGIDKDEAEEQLENILYHIKNLPDPVKLYRILMVDNEENINTEELGSHYSTNKMELLSSHSYLTGSGEKYFLVTVLSPKKLIDLNETVINNILYPNENEVTLKKKGKGVKIHSIRKIGK